MPEHSTLGFSKYFSKTTSDQPAVNLATNNSLSSSQDEEAEAKPDLPILDSQALSRCHVCLPDVRRPVGAVLYQNQFYCYVKVFSDYQAAIRAAQRLQMRDNPVILTRVPRGFVLWVMEPDAQPTSSLLSGC